MNIVIFDGYYIFDTLKKLGISQDKEAMKKLISESSERLGATHALVVFPDMARNYRKNLNSSFPLNRKNFNFLDLHQLGECRKTVAGAGIAAHQCVEYSFVDVCATIIEKLKNSDANYSLVTDCPLCLQLIKDDCVIINFDGSKVKDATWLANRYMMPASMIPDFYSIAGLNGIGVPRLLDIDKETLAQALVSFGGLYGVNEAIKGKSELGSLSGIAKQFEFVASNYAVIRAKNDARLGLSLHGLQVENHSIAA